jgi:hypothetical protein
MKQPGNMRLRWLAVTIAIALGLQNCAQAEYLRPVADEYAIKAVFLYNLVKYAEWPPRSPLSAPELPIVLAIVGEDPFGRALDEAVKDRTVRGRQIQVVRTSDPTGLKNLHMAFISAECNPARIVELVQALAARSVLTVGDTERTAKAGVAVNFVMMQGKVRFDIDQRAARGKRIELSSQLLKLARRVLEAEN